MWEREGKEKGESVGKGGEEYDECSRGGEGKGEREGARGGRRPEGEGKGEREGEWME